MPDHSIILVSFLTYLFVSVNMLLHLFMHNVENDQTYIKNLEVLAPQYFQSAWDYFSTFFMKGSKILRIFTFLYVL